MLAAVAAVVHQRAVRGPLWPPVLAVVVSIIAAVIIGVGLQKLQNKFTEWWDTRRGYAETP